MRYSVINRDSDYSFANFRNNLESLFDAMAGANITDSDGKFYQPMSEVRETPNDYKVSVQLPGIKKEDINIELNKNTLTISAESKFEDVKDEEKLHYSQIAYGKFHKTIEFAKDIDSENSVCDYDNGVLKITLKKQEEKKETKKLHIK